MSDQTPYDDRPTGPVSGAHPDIDELSAYADDSLDAAAAGVVGAHVETCAECAGDLRALTFVAGELATLPTPTMPADVALRLDQAIGRERRARPAVGGADTARRRGAPSWAGGAAAAVAIGLLAVIGIGAVTQIRQGAEDGAAKPAAGDRAGSVETGSGPPAFYVSGTNYAPGRVPGQLSSVLGRPADADLDPLADTFAQSQSVPAPAAATTSQAGRQASSKVVTQLKSIAADPARLRACVETLRPGGQPVAVDFARFEGQPAILIALPGEGSQLEVFIVGPKCGVDANTDDSLHFQVVNRP